MVTTSTRGERFGPIGPVGSTRCASTLGCRGALGGATRTRQPVPLGAHLPSMILRGVAGVAIAAASVVPLSNAAAAEPLTISVATPLVAPGDPVEVSGGGCAADTVTIYMEDATQSVSQTVVTTSADGSFSVAIPAPATPRVYHVVVNCQSQWEGTQVVVAPGEPPEPTAVLGAPRQGMAGDDITVHLEGLHTYGCLYGTCGLVAVLAYPGPVLLGVVPPEADGTVTRAFTLPDDLPPANGELVAIAQDEYGNSLVAEAPFSVLATERIAGDTRYATAAALSAQLGCLDDVGGEVVLARGDAFPDALSASYLAGQLGGPILLTASDHLPAETIAALREQGARRVTIVGGPGSVGQAVEDELGALPRRGCGDTDVGPAETLEVRRVFGADRYATAAAVASFPGFDAVGTSAQVLAFADDQCGEPLRTAILASGERYPDALIAAGLAYGGMQGRCPAGGPLPLLLSPPDALPASVADTIEGLGIQQVLVMGGTAAIGQDIKDGLRASGLRVAQYDGRTRYETVHVFQQLLANPWVGGYEGTTVLLTRPDGFADALAAAPLAGQGSFPLLLAESTSALGDMPRGDITGRSRVLLTDGALIGGLAALSDGVRAEVLQALHNQCCFGPATTTWDPDPPPPAAPWPPPPPPG